MNTWDTYSDTYSGSSPPSTRGSPRRSRHSANSNNKRRENGISKSRSPPRRQHSPQQNHRKGYYNNNVNSQYYHNVMNRNNYTHNGYGSDSLFHYNETLPPNAVEETIGPETISEDDDYNTPRVTPLSMHRTELDSKRKMKLRVRIEGIKNLIPPSRAVQHPPSTFVTVHAAYGRGKTPIIYNNANPPFNDEFVFEVTNPETEEITVTVVAVTNSGKKKFGQCILSVLNLIRGEERRKWVALVRHPGTERAYESGAMLISLYTDSFGAYTVPSASIESEFRERLRVLLRINAPEELHRLEWYVGECMDDYDGAFYALCKKYQKPDCKPATFKITIKSVSHLTEENSTPTTRETCYVKITAGRSKKTTKMVPYHRQGIINETFKMTLDNPKVGNISLAVYSANYKFGECLVSLNGVQKRVPKERTFSIVYAAGTGDASYSGDITVIIYSPTYGSDKNLSDREDEIRRIRVRNYLWKYLRDDLHRLDPIVTSLNDIDSFMKSWVREYGSEPKQYRLRLRIKNFRRENREENSKPYSVIIRIGPELHRTVCVRFTQDFLFDYEKEISVCNPEKEELLFIIVNESETNDVEIGRVAISLKNIKRDEFFQRKLQVFENALTTDATAIGSLFIEGIAYNFGLIEGNLRPDKEKYFRQRVEALLSRYNPSQLHRVEYLLGDYVGKEEQLISQLIDTYGPETGSAPMRIRILNIRDFVPMCSCYVKVYLNDTPVLRTKDHFASKSMIFDIDMKNEITVSLENPLRSMLKFKVAEHRRLRSSRLLGMAELSLRSMVREEPNICWIPIFNIDSNEEIGTLGVELQSPGFANSTVTLYSNPRNGSGKSVVEEVTRDVASLVRKYSPQNASYVQPLIAQASSLKEAHREIRTKLAPKPVVFTFYVHIDKVDMIQNEDKIALDKGLISLGAFCMEEQSRTSMKVAWAEKIDTRKFFPEIRMDITNSRYSTDGASNTFPLEITLHESSTPSNQLSNGISKRGSVLSTANRLLIPERELGRGILSLRALLTKRAYRLGEPVTVSIVRSNGRPITQRTVPVSLDTDRFAIVGEVTLRITIPAFEHIPHWLQFDHISMRRFHRAYVRYYERRIASFYRAYDPWYLRDLHFTLYERDVASAQWPLSLYDWLVALIKRYGPEPTTAFGPPPKLPFDPEAEEAARLRGGGGGLHRGLSSAFASSDRERDPWQEEEGEEGEEGETAMTEDTPLTRRSRTRPRKSRGSVRRSP